MGLQARTGGQVLADQLRIQGARLAFCVPGESYLELLDALHDRQDELRVIACRHEGAAANAAVAYGQLTGEPGVCMVTRGPGAAHAAVGVHTAAQDSTPLVLLVGQVARHERGRDSFQEVDYPAFFGGMAKLVEEVTEAARLPEVAARAWSVALSGRPGPVVLSLPEDVLAESCSVADAPPATVAEPAPTEAEVAGLLEMLGEASRPLVIVGGSGWDADSCLALRRWAEASRLPVATAFRQNDLLDNRSPSFVGGLGLAVRPSLAALVRESDVVLALGTRLDAMTTADCSLIEAPEPVQRLIHVHPSAEELGRVHQPVLAINSGVRELLGRLEALEGGRWEERTAAAHGDWDADRRPAASAASVNLGEVMHELRRRLPDDACLSNGAGNFTGFLQRHFEFRLPRTQLAPQSGAMGYGLPAALAAAACGRTACCVAGDGDFLMYASELATAVQEHLPVLVVVVDNGMYGTIRMHQERRHPGRVMATTLRNPDFAGLARSFGAHGETVARTEEFPAALERALAAGGPALVHLKVEGGPLSARG